MKHSWINILIAVAALLAFSISVPAFAQSPDDVNIHVAQEVAVPNHLLQPGNYILSRVESDDPEVYRLTNEDTMKVIGVLHVMPAPSNFDNTQLSLSAPDAAGLRVIQAWYPAGDSDGYQFSYSKKDIRKLDELAVTTSRTTGSAAGQP